MENKPIGVLSPLPPINSSLFKAASLDVCHTTKSGHITAEDLTQAANKRQDDL
jgi:hypothetical protein